jgi:hypothetical protein
VAITLLDVQRLKQDDYEKGVVETFIQECDISKKLPLVTIGTLEVRTKRTNSIPTVGFRARGAMHGTVAAGGTDTVADAVYSMGATIDIDKNDMRDKSPVTDPLTERTRFAVKGMAWTFNDYFINGDHGVDPDGFEGIKVRLALSPASQTLYGNTSSAALDVAAALASNTTSTMQTFLDRLDEAKYACDGHTADVCLTDADGIKAIKACLRRLNLYKDVAPDQPHINPDNGRRTSATLNTRPVFSWDGVDFYDMGLKADQSTKIIGNDTIGGAACRPFYFLKLGEPYIHGIQQYAMEISKPYMLDDGVTWRTVIDWPVGLRHVHPRFASVLKGVKVA